MLKPGLVIFYLLFQAIKFAIVCAEIKNAWSCTFAPPYRDNLYLSECVCHTESDCFYTK
jgi:hypothetical protein